MLVLQHFLNWLDRQGGVPWLARRTTDRAIKIYQALSHLPVKLVAADKRSDTAIVFDADNYSVAAQIRAQLKAKKIQYFEGHPAKGGFRLMNLPGLPDEHFSQLLDALELCGDK